MLEYTIKIICIRYNRGTGVPISKILDVIRFEGYNGTRKDLKAVLKKMVNSGYLKPSNRKNFYFTNS